MKIAALVLLAQSAPAEWIPLAPGNRWVYRVDADADAEFVHEVVGREKVGDTDCFVVEHRSILPGLPSPRVLRKEWLSSSPAGVTIHRLQRGRSLMEVERPFFKTKAALRKDDEWEGEAKTSENAPRYRVWVEDEEPVEVPAGKFTARRLRLKIEAGERYVSEGREWYARGVGLVKSEMTIRIGSEGTSIAAELKSFRPGTEQPRGPEGR
jgi:hypothetical protein